MSDLADTREKPPPTEPFAAPYVLALAVIDGAHLDAIYRLQKPQTTIGRGLDADIRIPDDQISKEHVSIEVTGNVYTIIDLNSRNGTLVNDKPITPQQRTRLKHMDEISVGDTRLLFTANRYRDR